MSGAATVTVGPSTEGYSYTVGPISGTIIELVGPDRRVNLLNEIQPASLVLGCF